MERKEITALVMIVMLAAFDTVDYEILHQILEKNFIISYITKGHTYFIATFLDMVHN